jgi:hypothetical protein
MEVFNKNLGRVARADASKFFAREVEDF